MRVAVLGGGLQGCCVALALAERGVNTVIFDRNDGLLSRTAVANEGKIHLGYMYANDGSYSTARMMMQGALAFAPFFARHLGLAQGSISISRPAAYVVHRDSQRTPDQVSRNLKSVHRLIREASEGRRDAYFGRDLIAEPRMWSGEEREAQFDPQVAVAAFDTPEVAIDPAALAVAVRSRMDADRRIDIRLRHQVTSVDDANGLEVVLQAPGGVVRERFDHVVNALWDGRFAVNETRGLHPNRPWLYRLKYGVSFQLPRGTNLPPSATFVSGPFGEVVSYANGLTCLTWYPICLQGISKDVTPPEWPTYPTEPLRSGLLEGTLKAMAQFVPSLRALNPGELQDVTVKGGVIVAWGETDIDDPASELHRRFEIGVTSTGRYHSVDPGKLTMAPYFADVCAGRILEGHCSMSGPLVTIGVPVYQGQDELPTTLECLRTQSYSNLDVLISVDAADQNSARACEPFLRHDSRFRMQIQSSRLGWAGNTDWTMRERRGAFYIFQQHDDQVSPTYVGDLVKAASRYPDAAICYAEVRSTGLTNQIMRGVPLLGQPIERVLTCLKFMDHAAFRGLIRGTALARTSGLLLSDFDPFDSYGTEMRFLMELALLGEFRFVPGPTYYKRLHGANLYLKREKWSEHQKQLAWACLCAWAVEVVVPAGRSPEERRRMFDRVLVRFLVPSNPLKRLRDPVRRLAHSRSRALHPLRVLVNWLKGHDPLVRVVGDRWMLYEATDSRKRAALLCIVLDRLRTAGRFDPSTNLNSTWETLQEEANKRFVRV